MREKEKGGGKEGGRVIQNLQKKKIQKHHLWKWINRYKDFHSYFLVAIIHIIIVFFYLLCNLYKNSVVEKSNRGGLFNAWPILSMASKLY